MERKITHIEAKMIYNLAKVKLTHLNIESAERIIGRKVFSARSAESAIFVCSSELYFERTVSLTGSSVVSGV